MLVLLASVLSRPAGAQADTIPLNSLAAAKSYNVKTSPVTYRGRRALRVSDAAAANTDQEQRLVVLPGLDFQDGIIEVDLAGDRMPGAPETARGFVGIAFRLGPDLSRYEAIYLRPLNGRAEDQLQRNHSAQYISVPEFPWQRLRSETPGKYETYVDLVPGEWTKVRVEVRGEDARLYVNGAKQPTLVVHDLKHGASTGVIALWIGPGTVAHFANLRVSKVGEKDAATH